MRIVAYRPTDTERSDPLRVDEVCEEAGTWPGDWAWLYAYNEDCFDPIRYLVRGEGQSADEQMQDAWAWLLCHPRIERELDVNNCWGEDEVAEAQRKFEAGEDVPGTEFTDSGLLLDTESLQMFGPVQVRLVRDEVLV